MRSCREVGLALVLALIAARPAAADELGFDPVVDGAITASAGVLWLANLPPRFVSVDRCRWCDDDGVDAAARGLRWARVDRANTLSNVTAYIVAPVSAAGVASLVAHLDGATSRSALINIGLVLEATFLVGNLTEVVKVVAARERPDVHAARMRGAVEHDSEDNLSFYSGHTSFVFSMATAAGTVATMRGYRHSRLLWTTGLAVAAATGYLRIAADRHYLTDVLTGAAVGSLGGALVPWWRGRRERVMLVASPGLVGLRGNF